MQLSGLELLVNKNEIANGVSGAHFQVAQLLVEMAISVSLPLEIAQWCIFQVSFFRIGSNLDHTLVKALKSQQGVFQMSFFGICAELDHTRRGS